MSSLVRPWLDQAHPLWMVTSVAVQSQDSPLPLPSAASGHTWRPAFATQLLEAGYDIRTIQALLGHRDVRTTMSSIHVLNRGGRGVMSPADLLGAPVEPVRCFPGLFCV